MESRILKDGFDHVFIDSGSPDSYLISNNDVGNLFQNDTNGTIFGGDTTSSSITNVSLFYLFNNVTTISTDFNGTYENTEDIAKLIQMAATSIVLGLMILITVIGNVFVIAAIILERNLQNVANYLVASLAVADLFVACLVMPLGAVYEISKGWILGPELCDIWTSCDVLCCTASILHLVAIATDRYWAVTNVDYMHSRTSKRVFTMIFLVWFASVVVSLAPQFGWKDPEYLERIEQQKCMVSQDIAYQVFATCCTFYVPLLVILVLYWKIYQTARKRIHRRRPRPVDITANNNQIATSSTSQISTVSHLVANQTNNDSINVDNQNSNTNNQILPSSGSVIKFTNNDNSHNNNQNNQIITTTTIISSSSTTNITTTTTATAPSVASTPTTTTTITSATPITCGGSTIIPAITTPSSITNLGVTQQQQNSQHLHQVTPISQTKQNHPLNSVANPHTQVNKRKETLEAKRERKAAKTLAIITGAFVVCWLPFFLMALLLPLCGDCTINDTIASFFLWLGYFNSTLNPVIYTIFSPEFRQAFKRILFGGHRSRNYRSGKI